MGEVRRCIEDVAVGDEAPVMRHTLSRTDLVRYAGASGDFNPMHHDETLATAAGQPSVFGHGMFSMGFLATAITRFVGIGNLVRYRVRFSRQTWPGETLVTRVVVKAVHRGDGATHGLVEMDVRLLSHTGEEKVVGEAAAVLPSRS